MKTTTTSRPAFLAVALGLAALLVAVRVGAGDEMPWPSPSGAKAEAPDFVAQAGSALFRAAQSGNLALVETLLAEGADPSATVERWTGDSSWTALMTASAEGHVDVVARLLKAGASVNQRSGRGRTALSFAAWYGRGAVSRLLMDAGSDPNLVDRRGLTPLMLAEARGDDDTITALRGAPLPVQAKPAPGRRWR